MNITDMNNSAVQYPVFANTSAVWKSWGNFEAIASTLERIADLLTVMFGVLLATSTYRFLHVGKQQHYPATTIVIASVMFAVVFVIMLEKEGAYYRANSLLQIRETERILRVSVQAFGTMLSITFLFSYLYSRWVLALAFFVVPMLLIAQKQGLALLVRYLHGRGYGLQNVLVYGAGDTGRQVFSALVRSPKLGVKPVAVVDDDERRAGELIYDYGYNRERSVPVIAGPLTAELIKEKGGRLVVVGIPSLSQQRLQTVAEAALEAGAHIAFVPQLSFNAETSTDYVDLDGVLITSLGRSGQKKMYETLKRIFDMVCSVGLLVISAPVWAAIATAIRIDSDGPVFFRQTRVGRNGKPFELYKFRSMRVDAPKYGFHPKDGDDPRITSIGRRLRRSSLDELPQLLNILKGDMSLVGPRPEMPFIVEQYSAKQRQRLQVSPGLTGLWQLSADRSFLIHENIQYDLYYIRDRNFFMDIAILFHTAVFAMNGI